MNPAGKKTAKVLNKKPKAFQSNGNPALHDIYLADTCKAACTAFGRALQRFATNCPCHGLRLMDRSG